MFERKAIWNSQVMIEPVNIVDIDGNRITPVGEFKYLGTLVYNQGGSTGEIIRRIKIAASIVSHLQCIWVLQSYR